MYYLVLTKFNMRFGNINSLLLEKLKEILIIPSLVLVWVVLFMFWPSQQPLNWAIKWSKLLKYRYNWLVWHSPLQLQSVVIVMLYMMNCTLFYIGWWKFIWKRDSYSLVISNSLLVSYCQSIKYQYISFDEL